jgi:adenylate cyclase
MAQEIERKFLVSGDGWRAAAKRSEAYAQGYLAGTPLASIRVRVAAGRAWLNIKSATTGIERQEYEYEIPEAEGRALLLLCEPGLIEKQRHFVPHGGLLWEVDEFGGGNAGLVVAEVELDSADQPFERPPWVGEEVSHDHRYYNVWLAKHPYRTWS